MDLTTLAVENSLVLASVSTLIAMLLGTMCAYSLVRFRTGGENLAVWIISQRLMPPIAIIFPIFLLYVWLGWVDTYHGLIVLYTAFSLPYVIWMMRGYIEEVPIELEESALVDGCTRWEVLWKVVFPMVRAGLFATAVFTFVFAWNDFIFALVLTRTEVITYTVQVTHYFGGQSNFWAKIAAMSVLGTVPIFIAVATMQRFLVRGRIERARRLAPRGVAAARDDHRHEPRGDRRAEHQRAERAVAPRHRPRGQEPRGHQERHEVRAQPPGEAEHDGGEQPRAPFAVARALQQPQHARHRRELEHARQADRAVEPRELVVAVQDVDRSTPQLPREPGKEREVAAPVALHKPDAGAVAPQLLAERSQRIQAPDLGLEIRGRHVACEPGDDRLHAADRQRRGEMDHARSHDAATSEDTAAAVS